MKCEFKTTSLLPNQKYKFKILLAYYLHQKQVSNSTSLKVCLSKNVCPSTIPRGNVTEIDRETDRETEREMQTRGACAWALGGSVSLRFAAFDSNYFEVSLRFAAFNSNCFEVSLRFAAFDSNCFESCSCKN